MKSKKRLVNRIITCVLAVASAAVAVSMMFYIRSFEHEHVAEQFGKQTRFAQITLFLPESAEFTADKIMYFRYKLDNALTEKAITPEKTGARLYADAYSAFADGTLYSSGKRSAKAKIAFVGGDYRLFHAAFADQPEVTGDINHDRILLSRSAAWQLYGGSELYDYTAEFNGKTYYISGVYDDFTGSDNEEFYADAVSATADILAVPEKPVTCYELILVDPVKNFAVDTVKECLDLAEGSYVLVENSKRFSLSHLFRTVPHIVSADEPLPTGVNLTPEELASRRAEKVLAVLLVIFLSLAVYPLIWLLILLYRLIRLIKRLSDRYLFDKLKDKFSYS